MAGSDSGSPLTTDDLVGALLVTAGEAQLGDLLNIESDEEVMAALLGLEPEKILVLAIALLIAVHPAWQIPVSTRDEQP